MNGDSAFQQLSRALEDGSLFTDTTNALALAQKNGFTVVNAALPDADGFLAVDEENLLPGYGSNKVIGVKDDMDAGRKMDMIAQELGRYAVEKTARPDEVMKLIHRDTLKTSSANIAACIGAVRSYAKSAAPAGTPTKGEAAPPAGRAVLHTVGQCLEMDSYAPEIQIWGDVWEDKAEKITGGKKQTEKERLAEELEKTRRFLEERSIISGVSHTTAETNESLNTQHQTECQKERDKKITGFFSTYITLFEEREKNKIQYRKWLFTGSCLLTVGIIAASFVLLFRWMPVIITGYDTAKQPLQLEITVKNELDDADAAGGNLFVITIPGDTQPDAAGNSGGDTDAGVSGANEGDDTDVDGSAASGGETNADSSASGDDDLTGAMKALLEKYLEDNELLGMFTALVSQAQSGGTSDTVRDIVSLVTICLTILGSILAIIRLFSHYILPANEEESMHSLMRTIQQNDFDHEMVLLLKKNAADSATILSYLTLRSQRLSASGAGGASGSGQNGSGNGGGSGDQGGGSETGNGKKNGNQNSDDPKKDENGQT